MCNFHLPSSVLPQCPHLTVNIPSSVLNTWVFPGLFLWLINPPSVHQQVALLSRHILNTQHSYCSNLSYHFLNFCSTFLIDFSGSLVIPPPPNKYLDLSFTKQLTWSIKHKSLCHFLAQKLVMAYFCIRIFKVFSVVSETLIVLAADASVASSLLHSLSLSSLIHYISTLYLSFLFCEHSRIRGTLHSALPLSGTLFHHTVNWLSLTSLTVGSGITFSEGMS